VTDVVKITETGLKIMEAEELSIGDEIAENTLVELSVAIPVRTMIPARPPALVSWENISANNAYVFTSPAPLSGKRSVLRTNTLAASDARFGITVTGITVTVLDCTPGMRHDNLGDRLI
jgi:hypothetical protein